MARIVYGVAGEGLGHAARARVMIAHLESLGHTVKVVSYERGYASLKDHFDCFEAEGLHIGIRDNKVAVLRCLVENLRKAPNFIAKCKAVRRLHFDDFEPHAVVTDFEPITAYLARLRGLPLISIDNQHAMRFLDVPCPRRLLKDRAIARLIVRATVPTPDATLITTFFSGDVTGDRVFLFDPILRQTVIDRAPTKGEHIVVYHTRPYQSFLNRLKTEHPHEKFIVYGYNESRVDGPLEFRAFSVDRFLDDLATCKAVMATAGFTLITEALQLRKPYLATPQNGQFEQELNAIILAKMGFGENARNIGPDTIHRFLNRLGVYEEKLASYSAANYNAIKDKLGHLTADDCALAQEYRARRKGLERGSVASASEEENPALK